MWSHLRDTDWSVQGFIYGHKKRTASVAERKKRMRERERTGVSEWKRPAPGRRRRRWRWSTSKNRCRRERKGESLCSVLSQAVSEWAAVRADRYIRPIGHVVQLLLQQNTLWSELRNTVPRFVFFSLFSFSLCFSEPPKRCLGCSPQTAAAHVDTERQTEAVIAITV